MILPDLTKIPVKIHRSFDYKENSTSIIPFDLSSDLKTSYKATSPNLLASFVKVVGIFSLSSNNFDRGIIPFQFKFGANSILPEKV